MSFTHYYYALDREAAESVFNLTWKEFVDQFGWGRPSQWNHIGGYLAFFLTEPSLPEKPSSKMIAPILREPIRKTICRMTLPYFGMLEMSYQMRKRSFVKLDLDAEGLEDDSVALVGCAIRAFLDGNIDDDTLWPVLAIHTEMVTDFLKCLREIYRQRVRAVWKRFGRCRPVFSWQTVETVQDGHTALSEGQTQHFGRFLALAWRRNWPVQLDGDVGPRFRDIKLVRNLYAARAALRGNCLIRYWGS